MIFHSQKKSTAPGAGRAQNVACAQPGRRTQRSSSLGLLVASSTGNSHETSPVANQTGIRFLDLAWCFCSFLLLSANVNEFSSIPTVGTPPTTLFCWKDFFQKELKGLLTPNLSLLPKGLFWDSRKGKVEPFSGILFMEKKSSPPSQYLGFLVELQSFANLKPREFGGTNFLAELHGASQISMSCPRVCGHGKMLSNLEPKICDWLTRT